MWNEPVLFKKMPIKGRTDCDALLMLGVIMALIALGLIAVMIKQGGDNFAKWMTSTITLLSVIPLLSCFLLAKANPIGRILAWLIIPIFIFRPFRLLKIIQCLHSAEMSEFLKRGATQRNDSIG